MNYIIKKIKKRNDIKTSMNKHGIKYIEQLLDGECKEFVTWKRLAHNLGKISKSRELRWFKEVCVQVMSNENPSLSLIVPNPFTIRIIKNETMIKNRWVTNNVELVGRVRKIEDNLVMIRHWHTEGNKITKACSGYNEHISSRTNTGVIKIHTHFLLGIVINKDIQ